MSNHEFDTIAFTSDVAALSDDEGTWVFACCGWSMEHSRSVDTIQPWAKRRCVN